MRELFNRPWLTCGKTKKFCSASQIHTVMQNISIAKKTKPLLLGFMDNELKKTHGRLILYIVAR